MRSAQLEAAQAELARVEAGESDADRWQLEQRVRHAENQLAVANGTTSPPIHTVGAGPGLVSPGFGSGTGEACPSPGHLR